MKLALECHSMALVYLLLSDLAHLLTQGSDALLTASQDPPDVLNRRDRGYLKASHQLKSRLNSILYSRAGLSKLAYPPEK